MSDKVTELELLETREKGRRRGANPTRTAQLDYLKKRRNELGPATLRGRNGESYGFSAMCIPEFDFEVLKARIPDVVSKDAETRERAWARVISSGLARAMGWLTDDSVGRKKPNQRIVVK